MLKLLKKLSLNEIKKWISKNKVIDIILFGSLMRGKENPNDVDLCIIINETDERNSLDLIDSLGKITDKNKEYQFQINLLTEKQFFEGNTLTKTLIKEGFSIKSNKRLSEVWGFENRSQFIYSLKHFSNSERVKFHYLLNGRYGREGVLSELNAKIIGDGVMVLPSENEDILKDIFDKWNVNYKIQQILIG